MPIIDDDLGVQRAMRQGIGLGVAIGVLIIVMGFVAVAKPLLTTLAATFLFGWIFLLSGIFRVAYAIVYVIETGRVGRFVFKLLISLVLAIAGLMLLVSPQAGALSFTLILGIAIIAQGALLAAHALQLRPQSGWLVALGVGMASMVLGSFILNQWPNNNPGLIGLFIGTSLWLDGIWIIVFSLALRQSFQAE